MLVKGQLRLLALFNTCAPHIMQGITLGEWHPCALLTWYTTMYQVAADTGVFL